MASYNYLGMANDPRVIEAAKKALDDYGVGACGSPLLSGMTDLHRELEKRMATFLNREDCILFSSGFGGALGILAGLLRRDDVAVMDEKCHISLLDGVKLSGAKLELFRHNDAVHLEELLIKHEGKRRIVGLEGIYSMDGDYGDLPAISKVAKKHGVGILIDEAHSILTSGLNGRGAVEHFNCEKDVVLQYATFSKAFASVGGFVAGPKELLGYLRFFASSYGFSCALPPSVVAGVIAVLDIIETDKSSKQKLEENTEYFRHALQNMGIDTGESTSQVIPIIIGSNRKLLYELGIALRDEGLFIAPVDFPSVPEDSLRFRASVSAAHSREELDRAIDIIRRVIVPHIKMINNNFIFDRINKQKLTT
jgi:7-keto-8-aminopelargonate synthetase-like enzyme